MKIINITEESGIPLIGCIAFGIIDRGSNLIQVRATSICNLNCPFCSTNSGPNSKFHQSGFIVELNYLLKWVQNICKIKGPGVEINIDSAGEPLTYPKIVELVESLKKIPEVKQISMQTNGTLLTKDLIDKFENKLDRINLSLNSLDPEKSKFLSGCNEYNINKIIELARYIARSKIELLIAPVWIPNINDQDIIDIIKFAKNLNVRLGIQKYETYKYSRKIKKAKKINFYKFYRKLGEWEKEFGVKLKIGPIDFGIYKTKKLPLVFQKNDIVQAIIKSPGWFKDQCICVSSNTSITIDNCDLPINSRVRVKILENKNNIYIARLV